MPISKEAKLKKLGAEVVAAFSNRTRQPYGGGYTPPVEEMPPLDLAPYMDAPQELNIGSFTHKRASIIREELEAASDEYVEHDIKDLLGALRVTVTKERTLVYIVVVDKKGGGNSPHAIRCNHGNAFGGYTYDAKIDSYLVTCVEVKEIGWLNRSLSLSLPYSGNWRVPVPLPESVIDRYLSAAQLRLIKAVREKYSAEQYEVHFIQIQGCSC